jgi:hypothetical protein
MKPERFFIAISLAILAIFGVSTRTAVDEPVGAGGESAAQNRDQRQANKPRELKPGPIPQYLQSLQCEAAGKRNGEADCGRPDIILATIPDPEQSGIPALLDSGVESIQRAAAQGEFSLYRWQLPWSKPTGLAAAPSAAGFSNGALDTARIGLLAFRGASRALIVLLVGETPMRGVDQEAFRTAVEASLSFDAATVRVLGPTFSGSVPSLRQVARNFRRAKFRFVSGTATRYKNMADFAEDCIEYFSMVENDQEAMREFMDFLGSRGIARERVALLVEAGTMFGQALSRDPSQPGLTVEFPMQISRLRAAYRNNPSLRALWRASGGNGGPRLEGSFEVAGSERPPTFATEQTAMELELGMASLALTLNQQGTQLAIIAASDQADTLFLAKLFQRLSPNVRLATLDSDLMFLHSTPDVTFAGMLMATAYPLWPSSEIEAKGNSAGFRPFTSRSAQGVFNAARMLIEGKSSPDSLASFRNPVNPGRRYPPVWVTAVGGGSIWPVALLAQNPEMSSLEEVARERKQADAGAPPELRFPRRTLFTIVYVAASALAAWMLWSYWAFATSRNRYSSLFKLPEIHSWCRTVLFAVVVAGGFTVYPPFIAVILPNPELWSPFAFRLLAIPAVLLPAVCVPLGFLPKKRDMIMTTLILTALALFDIREWWKLGDISGPDPGTAFGFVARTLNPFSGVDPAVPNALVWSGVVLWAALHLHRMRMAEERDPLFPAMTRATSPAGICTSAFADLRRRLNAHPWTWHEWMVLLVAAVIAAAAGFRPRMGLEPLVWQYTFAAGFLLVWMLATAAGVKLILISRSLDTALRPLRWIPAGDAFRRLTRDISVSRMWARADDRFPLETVNYSIDALERIPASQLTASDMRDLKRAKDAVKACRTAARDGLRVPIPSARLVHISLTRVANRLGRSIWGGRCEAGWATAAQKEEYIAVRVVAIVRYAVLHMRLLLEFTSFAVAALFLAILSYPFQPQATLINAVSALTLFAGAAALYVLYRLDENDVLQRLRQEEKTSWNESFYAKAIRFGFLPVLAAMANHFPGALRKISVLVEPLTQIAAK